MLYAENKINTKEDKAIRFTLYLQKQGYMPNTINKKVSCFRKLCNLAAMEGYNKYCKLREENFITYNKSGLITLTQKKTGKKVEVPVFDDRVYELCEKYNYNFPDITAQKMNLKIKVVGYELSKTVPSFCEKYVTVLTGVEKRSEQTYEKLLKKKKDGIKFTENERKWFHKLDKWAKIRNGSPLWERNKHGEVVRAKYELICSHTARRSGTTNLYKLGVLSDLELRSITGHESQKNFEGYIRIGISEQAQRVGDKIKAAREAMKKQVDK